jgi:hypothetical protein
VGFVSREDPLDEKGFRIPTFLNKRDPRDVELIDILVEATPDEPSFSSLPMTRSDGPQKRVN